jgi:nicotinate-nucleotide adenylyltransferase
MKNPNKYTAFFGGSFDPPHNGHLAIAHVLLDEFGLDEFIFIPAFHAPHKRDKKPTSAFHRFAMLALATKDEPRITVSKIELEVPERPYSVETLGRLRADLPRDRIFFVIGADSWNDITTWREWETVLSIVDVIVVTRPDHQLVTDHVTDAIRGRVVDLRGGKVLPTDHGNGPQIYFTDAVHIDVSATEIRRMVRDGRTEWRRDVPVEVANYVEKYELYR